MKSLPNDPFYLRLKDMDLLTPEEIGRLTAPERLSLIAQLWDSLGQDQLPVSPAQQAELDYRLASIDEDRKSAVTWAALKAELEERCP